MILTEELSITPKEKTELTERFLGFLFYMEEHHSGFSEMKPEEILTLWLRHTEKPEWLERKIDKEGVQVVSVLHELVDDYKKNLHRYSEEGTIKPIIVLDEKRQMMTELAAGAGKDLSFEEKVEIDDEKVNETIRHLIDSQSPLASAKYIVEKFRD